MLAKPTVEELIHANHKVDAALIASAIAAINEIQKTGFVADGYRLTGRRSTITEKKREQTAKPSTLPRRHT